VKAPVLRAALQLRQLQFHWGRPPPAAEPRILMCTVAGEARRFPAAKPMTALGAAGVDVRRDFHAQDDLFEFRLDPFHINSLVKKSRWMVPDSRGFGKGNVGGDGGLFRFPQPHAMRIQSDWRPAYQFSRMPGQHLHAQRDLAQWRQFDEPENAAIGELVPHRKRTEILVSRDNHPLSGSYYREDFVVTGVFVPVSDEYHIVTGPQQLSRKPSARTSIHQQFHASEVASTGSNRSRPTNRAAYNRHA